MITVLETIIWKCGNLLLQANLWIIMGRIRPSVKSFSFQRTAQRRCFLPSQLNFWFIAFHFITLLSAPLGDSGTTHGLTWASLDFHRCVLLQLPLHWRQMVEVHRTGAHRLGKAGSTSLSLYKSDLNCLGWHTQACRCKLLHFPPMNPSQRWTHLVSLEENHKKGVHSVGSQSSTGHRLHRWSQTVPGAGSLWSTESELPFHNWNLSH